MQTEFQYRSLDPSQTEDVVGVDVPRIVREANERRLAAIGAENKRRMELTRRESPVELARCTCGRDAILTADSFRPGRYIIHCESYWDAEGWSCPEGRATDSYADPGETAEAWNSGQVNLYGLANSELSQPHRE